MKKICTSLLIMTFLFTWNIQAQTHVKHDAAGANDGTSWANAYTDLEEALNSSSMGEQIWVASGTYKPGGASPTTTSSFTFPQDLQLFGGFAGTETMLSERDWSANETILSGDHNGDDVENDFENNRSDNSRHVLFLTDTVTVNSTIDGFTISNGNTDPDTGSGNSRRGGGMLTYGPLAVRNCTFTQNYGYFGGGLYPRGGSDIIIEDCTFELNHGGFGGGLYLNAFTAIVNNCIFDSNTSASLGGGYYNNSANGTMISNCTFTSNHSLGSRGGGLYTSTSPSTISNCIFTENSAQSSSGGGMQVRNTSDDESNVTVEIMDCTFTGNSATYGGGLGVYDRKSTVNMTNCLFETNTSENVGGGISNAFGASINIDNSTFVGNQSGSGGAIYSQNDSAKVSILLSSITANTASSRGGGVAISGDGEFSSPRPISVLTIKDSYLTYNNGTDQGGAINLVNADMNLENVLIDNNLTIDGTGGGIALNTSDSISTQFSIMNSTITNNTANIGAGIANWMPGPQATSFLTFQNTILYNSIADNYLTEDGDPTVISNGGNLSSDPSVDIYFTNTNDLNETIPQFVDFGGDDYHLQASSPCINTGISAGAPTTDIEGLPRVEEIDMGAFENQNPVGVSDQDIQFGQLVIFPNPVQDDLNIRFEAAWKGVIQISIISIDGKVIVQESVEKHTDNLSHSFKVNNLPSGQYELVVMNSNGLLRNAKAFVK